MADARGIVKQASRSSACILEAPSSSGPELVPYDVLLLAGEPQRHLCALPSGIEAGSEVVVAGETWTVADVRRPKDGGVITLICIYAS